MEFDRRRRLVRSRASPTRLNLLCCLSVCPVHSPLCEHRAVFFTPFVFTTLHPTGYIPFPVFVVGAIISTAAFTFGSVVLLTLFSRLIDGSEGQGIFMGYFNASRALSRVVAPIVVGLLWDAGGAFLVFVPTAIALFTGLWMNIAGLTSMDPPEVLRVTE